METKGLVIEKGTGRIAYDRVDLAEPGPDDAVVASRYVGICRSDLELLDGDFDSWVSVDYPIVIGHEWSGEVLSVGANVTGLEAGDRVVGECVDGHERWFGLTFDGAGSDRFVVPARLLHLIPEGIDHRQAAMVEPFTIAYRAVQLASPVDGGDVVAIVGGGMVGQCVQVIARASGATTVLIEPSEERRRLAASMGVDAALDPTQDGDLSTALEQAAGVAGASVVVEASGSAAGIAATYDLAGQGATIVNVGVCPDPQITAPLAQIQAKNLTIKGMTGSTGVWPRALRFIARHGIDLAPLASHDFSFAEVEAAVAAARDASGSLKVLLHP